MYFATDTDTDMLSILAQVLGEIVDCLSLHNAVDPKGRESEAWDLDTGDPTTLHS